MKKQTAAFLLAGILLVCGGAAAEKARYLSRDGDKAYHSSHLAMHAGLEDCRICGNYLKVRSRANGNASVIGHVEQADLVRLQEVSGGWARILVLYSAETSPDSYAGLEGWVDAAYVECGCSERTYYAGGVDAVQGGEVMGGGVNLRELPSGSSRSLGKLSRGERVRVLGRYASGGKTCYRVVRTCGQSGCISEDYLDVGGSVPAMAYEGSAYASSYGTDETTDRETVSAYGDWKALLDAYYNALQKEDRDGLIGCEPYLISLDGAGYRFYDADSDGEEELLILDDDEAVAALYTRKNGRIFHVFDGWERNRYSLCADGTFYNAGSDGADKSIEAILRLSGTKMAIVEAIYTHPIMGNGYEDAGCYYTDREEAYAQWFIEEMDPTLLGAVRISESEFRKRSEQMMAKASIRLNGILYFRNYR